MSQITVIVYKGQGCERDGFFVGFPSLYKPDKDKLILKAKLNATRSITQDIFFSRTPINSLT